MKDLNQFLSHSTEERLKEYRNKDDRYWRESGEKMALKLFKEASVRVPAYKDFLKKNNINPSKIKTIDDYRSVPLTDKQNYINVYKLKDLCWDGKLENSYFISSSSGSTGVPNFWPRSIEQTIQGAQISELIYREFFDVTKQPTLYIVAFAMGMWIAGTYMMSSTELVALKGYPITVATPGMNRDEILRLVRLGHKEYKQVVLVGYPPFIKDVVDKGIEENVPWAEINIKFLFTGEAFTERWRDHLQKKTAIKNILTDSINMYGSADVGLVAHETPLTIFLRRSAFDNKKVLSELFSAERIPSVNQYDPRLRYFEKVGEELVVSCRSGIPLIRYNTKDVGDILYFDDINGKLSKHGIDLAKEFNKRKLTNKLWRNPCVFLFGRGKFTATIYGITIFPEFIKYILDNEKLSSYTTGKYIISTEETKGHNQELHLKVELKENISKTKKLNKLVVDTFVSELPTISSEYKHLLSSMGDKVHPKVYLYEYGHPEYFPRGVVRKNA